MAATRKTKIDPESPSRDPQPGDPADAGNVDGSGTRDETSTDNPDPVYVVHDPGDRTVHINGGTLPVDQIDAYLVGLAQALDPVRPIDEAELSGSTDAMLWARAWTQRARAIQEREGDIIDTGWMVGWFSNYWAAVVSDQNEARRELDTGAERPAANVIEAINRVKRDLPGIGKDSTSKEVPYAYRGIETLTAHLQGLTAHHGIVIMPVEVVERDMYQYQTGTGTTWHEVRLRFRWAVYGPGGPTDVIYGESWGFGRDNSDKGASKAQTQAFKEFMIKLFCIGDKSTDGDASPASENEEFRQDDTEGGRTYGAGQAPPAPPRNWVTLGWMAEPAKAMSRAEVDQIAAAVKADHDGRMTAIKAELDKLPQDVRTELMARRKTEVHDGLPFSPDEVTTWATMVQEAATAHAESLAAEPADEAQQTLAEAFDATEAEPEPDQSGYDGSKGE